MKFFSGLDKGIQLDSIVKRDTATIVSALNIDATPLFVLVEKMAQLGAFHVRTQTDFSMHIFLMGIRHLPLPATPPENGDYLITAIVKAFSERSFSYDIRLHKKDLPPVLSGNFLFAGITYNEQFQSHILKPHYQKVAQCLKNDSPRP